MKRQKEAMNAATETASFPSVFEKQTIFAALIYLTITLVVFWPAALDPTHTIPAANFTMLSANSRFDVYQSLWGLWWSSFATFSAHTSLYFTSLLYYPIGADLTTLTLMPVSGIISAPLQLLGLAFAYNALIISGFTLCALFTYLLARYLIKDRLPSFIAGIIFSFSAVNISHAYIFLDWASSEWIPLFLIFFLLALKTGKHRYIFGAAISFFFINFMGNFEEGLMVIIFTLSMLYFGIFSGWKKEVLNKRTLISIAEMSLVAIIISMPLLLPILQDVISGQIFPYLSDIGILNKIAWSDSVSSFFLPSQFNGIFSSAVSGYSSSLGNYGYAWEGISYIGYTVILLSIIAIYYDFKKNGLSNLLVWISLIIFFGWLSLGPLIKISGNYTSIPGIYLVYSLVPILNIMREPGRFDIFVSLCLAIVSAYGLKYMLENKALNGNRQKIAVTAIISILILIECSGLPISQQFVSKYYANVTIPQGYYSISKAPNATVLVLPIQSAGQAMYYQTAFQRPIIGGYIGRSTSLENLYSYYIPIASIYSQSVLINNATTDLYYPIIENYTQANLVLISKYNVSYISIIKSQYSGTELASIDSGIKAIYGNLIYNDSSTAIYYIPKAETLPSNNTAFISGGALDPAEYLNGYGDPGVWWIIGTVNITIYSTRVQNATFCANLMSNIDGSISAEENSNMVANGTIYNGNNTYSTVFLLNKGYNVIEFYPSYTKAQLQNQSSNLIGFRSIRILYNDSSMQCAT